MLGGKLKLTIGHLIQAASITGVAVFMMAACAGGAGILTMNQSPGRVSMLTSAPDPPITNAIPAELKDAPGAQGAFFNPFTFELITAGQRGIVAPNSDEPGTLGESKVQRYVISVAVPEPITRGLVGGALIVLGMLGRKKLSRQ